MSQNWGQFARKIVLFDRIEITVIWLCSDMIMMFCMEKEKA